MKIKNCKLKITFFGGSKYVIPILEKLKKNFDIELVVTTEKEKGAVLNFCVSQDIPCLSVSSLSDKKIKDKILNTKSELAIVADFRCIIPKEILNHFKLGILNIHPSLLPKYRGSTPVQTAILSGDKSTGVSLIKLDDQLDHGDILSQVEETIKDNDTSQSLYERLFEMGSVLLDQNIKQYIKGELKLSKQDHKKASFTKISRKNDGYFDPNNPPSYKKLSLMIRAYYPWPGTWTHFCLSSNGQAKVVKFLPEKKVQVEGKKPVSYIDFINGYPKEGENLLKKLNLI